MESLTLAQETNQLVKYLENGVNFQASGSKGDAAIIQAAADIIYESSKQQGLEMNIWTPNDPELKQIFGKFGQSWQTFDYAIKELTDKLDGRLSDLEVFISISESFKSISPLVIDTLFPIFQENTPDLLILNSGQLALMYPLIKHFDIPFALFEPYYLCHERVAKSGKFASNLLPPFPDFLGDIPNGVGNAAIRWVFENLFAVHAKSAYKNACAKFGEEFDKAALKFSSEDAEMTLNFANPPYGKMISFDENGKMTLLDDISEVEDISCLILPRGVKTTGIKDTIPFDELSFINQQVNPVMVVINGATSSEISAQKDMLEVLKNSVLKNNMSYIVIDVANIPDELKVSLPPEIHVTKGMVNLEQLTFRDSNRKIIGWSQHGGSGISSISQVLGIPSMTVYAVKEQERNAAVLKKQGFGMQPIARKDVFIFPKSNSTNPGQKQKQRFVKAIEEFKTFAAERQDLRRSEHVVNEYYNLQTKRLHYLTNRLLKKVVEKRKKN
jgi:hypothetical protein